MYVVCQAIFIRAEREEVLGEQNRTTVTKRLDNLSHRALHLRVCYGAWSFLRSSVGDGVGVERSKARPIINKSPVKLSADHSMYKCGVNGIY